MSLSPQYHPDADGMAFNVKDRCRYRRDLRGTEAQRNAAYESMQERWWRDANAKAIELGFSGTFSTGRSGGWLVPQLDGEVITVPPTSIELFKLEELGTALDAMMASTEDRFVNELQDVLDIDAEEEAEEAASQAAIERHNAGFDALVALATAVIACDTTSGCLKTQARNALELVQ